MHISFDCATQRHHECDTLLVLSSYVGICQCPCHDATNSTDLRQAEQLLTGQEA